MEWGPLKVDSKWEHGDVNELTKEEVTNLLSLIKPKSIVDRETTTSTEDKFKNENNREERQSSTKYRGDRDGSNKGKFRSETESRNRNKFTESREEPRRTRSEYESNDRRSSRMYNNSRGRQNNR